MTYQAKLLFILLVGIAATLFSPEQRSFAQDDVRSAHPGGVLRRASTAPRIALVMGNAEYRISGNRLDNPVNDARLVKQTLESLGFDVLYGENLTTEKMRSKIEAFGQKLSKGCVALFYYAGHGVQYRGANFMIPIDARELSENEIDGQAVDVNLVLDAMSAARSDVNIVLLDACRDNRLTRAWGTRPKGLSEIRAPKGTVIAYATSPGSVAEDGKSANSPYTTSLIHWLKEPCLKIEDMFKRVRTDVLNATNERQLTWESISLVGDFYFVSDGCADRDRFARKNPEAPIDNRRVFPVGGNSKSRKVLLHMIGTTIFYDKKSDLSSEFINPFATALSGSGLLVESSANLNERDRAQLDGYFSQPLRLDDNDKDGLRWLPYALAVRISVYGYDLEKSYDTYVAEASASIFVYRTDNKEIVESYISDKVRGFGLTQEQARRNAVRAAAQGIPDTFIKSVADKAK